MTEGDEATRGEFRSALLAVGVTVILFGLSYGVLADEAGLDLLQTIATSTIVMAGAVQFASVGALLAGASPTAAFIAGAAVTLRYLPLGALASTVVRPRADLNGVRDIHLMTDQTIMLGRTAEADAERIRRYRISGVIMITTWVFGTVLGYLASSQALRFDPAAIGLDAAYPALFLTLMIGDLRADRRALRVALTGAAIGAVAVAVGQRGLAPALATFAVLVALIGSGSAAPAARDTDAQDEEAGA